MEEKTVFKILKIKECYILGGGAFSNEKLRKEIVSNHISFWLDCSNKTLLNRIRKNKRRPLANKLTNKELIELIIKRKKNYIKANFRIDCDKFNKIQTVNNIIKLYETI